MRKNVRDIEIGTVERLDFLYLDSEMKLNKNGKPYTILRLSDGYGKFEAKHWDITPEQISASKGQIISCELKVSKYNDRLDYQVSDIYLSTSSDVSMNDFIMMPPYDIDMMYSYIIDTLSGYAARTAALSGEEEPISNIAISLLRIKEKEFKSSSAAVSMHHDCYGGLLYHTYEMFLTAEGMKNAFPYVDMELLLSAVAIHDFGKIVTYNTSVIGVAELDVTEILSGHPAIGMQYVLAEAKRHRCNPEKVRLLSHMVASHHGKLEWGAIQTPVTPEAFLLFAIDYISSRVNMYRKVQAGLEPGKFSNKQFALDNTNVYRPMYQDGFDG